MDSINVVLAKMSDWQALYINDRLIAENHRIDFNYGIVEIMKAGGNILSFRVVDVEEDGCFYNDLNQVKILS